jgi:simple sugar transport system ATP-binding protein
LAVPEIEILFSLIRSLKNNGKTIIFVSHKLSEVKRIADEVTVIRKGKIIKTFSDLN